MSELIVAYRAGRSIADIDTVLQQMGMSPHRWVEKTTVAGQVFEGGARMTITDPWSGLMYDTLGCRIDDTIVEEFLLNIESRRARDRAQVKGV